MFNMCGQQPPRLAAAFNVAPALCFFSPLAVKWGLVGTAAACICSTLMKARKRPVAPRSVPRYDLRLTQSIGLSTTGFSHRGYSVCGKPSLTVLGGAAVTKGFPIPRDCIKGFMPLFDESNPPLVSFEDLIRITSAAEKVCFINPVLCD